MEKNYFNTCELKIFDPSLMSWPVWSLIVTVCLSSVLSLAAFPMQISPNDTRVPAFPRWRPMSIPGQGSSWHRKNIHKMDARDKKYSNPRWPRGCGHVMRSFECGDNQERAFHPEYMGTHNTWPKLPSQITSWIMRLDTKPGQRTHYPDIRRQLVPGQHKPSPHSPHRSPSLSHSDTF